jgi:hypothetical protein
MEPLLIVLLPGVLGGVILAVLLASRRITVRTGGVERRLAPPSPSLINMAHIPVEGGGGLGIVAAVIAVALAEPRIRVLIGIAALCGGGLAWALIAWRRHRGPLISGGDDSGPHSVLGLSREQQPGRVPSRSNGPGRYLAGSKARGGGVRFATGH